MLERASSLWAAQSAMNEWISEKMSWSGANSSRQSVAAVNIPILSIIFPFDEPSEGTAEKGHIIVQSGSGL
jgi:hypothetical protein